MSLQVVLAHVRLSYIKSFVSVSSALSFVGAAARPTFVLLRRHGAAFDVRRVGFHQGEGAPLEGRLGYCFDSRLFFVATIDKCVSFSRDVAWQFP